MEDRFKFRVYYKPHNKVYNVICLNCDRQKEIIIEYKGSTAIVEWENCEIIQCTGLKDKNGKLIYEGDILQENWHKYKLEWGNGAYTIKDIKRGTSYMFTSGMCIHKSEVIGNIYENKELLNEI